MLGLFQFGGQLIDLSTIDPDLNFFLAFHAKYYGRVVEYFK